MIRLNKFLAHAGIASRRKCDEYIKNGLITVNGEVMTTLGVTIDEEQDIITYNGKEIKYKEPSVYIILNKPAGVISSVKDEFERDTIMSFIDIPQRVYPIGRLDYETTGVLLLTNDGELTNLLLHPRYKVEKVYHALIDRRVRPVDLHQLRNGVQLEDDKTIPCEINEIRIIDNQSFLEIKLRQGLNRQIRRMFELFDYQVEELERISFSGITAHDLKQGEWRYLSNEEITHLRNEVNYEDRR
jgi:23S rRNA pseudouridine2605 synthase